MPKCKRRMDGTGGDRVVINHARVDDREDRRPLRGDLQGEGVQGHDQRDHEESHRRTSRMVVQAGRCDLSGDLRRRDRGQGS